jgi:hypothetical protein
MKTLKTFLILFIVSIIGGNISAFAGNNEKTEIRKVKNFSAIKVSTGIDLYLTMGNSEEVKIVADDNDIDEIITKVENNTLHIYMKKTSWFNWGSVKSKKAYVTIKELEGIYASSGSDVRSENTLKGESLEVKASSGSDVKIDIVYKNVSLDSSSGSDLAVSGKSKNLEVEASSGSDIKAQDLESVNCEARASSGSDITVNVSENLKARASSGADIKYYGNPTTKNIDESSGGDVKSR